MYRVLFVTDDWSSRKKLKSELLERGFSVSAASSADVFSEEFAPEKKVDVVVLDFERCATEGTKLCRGLRRERTLKDCPLIVLVSEGQAGTLDYSCGIEDFVILPVSATHLAERMHFVMWKLNRIEVRNGLKFGGLTIDFERYEVRVKGELADLTYKEFELLKFLATHPEKVFTREVLLDKVWGYDYYGGTRTVDVHVRRLRSKIETGRATFIETVRNVGYKFLGS